MTMLQNLQVCTEHMGNQSHAYHVIGFRYVRKEHYSPKRSRTSRMSRPGVPD